MKTTPPTIEALIGDMFASDMQTIINTVNCVGIMGKGIAQIFKKEFPTRACQQGLHQRV